ncbi:hypothetical protein [Georgfuchsia toluolica]
MIRLAGVADELLDELTVISFPVALPSAHSTSAIFTLVRAISTAACGHAAFSGRTMRSIKQNLFFVLIYNGVGVPVAAGVLHPFFGILLSPIFAAAAMNLSSISAITSALRLRRV